MSIRRSVLLKGSFVEVNENGVASAVILPGTLVTGVTSLAPSTANGAFAPPTYAMERSELGRGVDDTFLSSGTDPAAYAIGDVVKVLFASPGVEHLAILEDAQNVAVGDFLTANNADGTLRAVAAGENIIAEAMEAVNASGNTLIHVRAMPGYLDV